MSFEFRRRRLEEPRVPSPSPRTKDAARPDEAAPIHSNSDRLSRRRSWGGIDFFWQLTHVGAVLALGCAGLGCSKYVLHVPSGATGRMPDYVGRPCGPASGRDVFVTSNDGASTWAATGEGSVKVDCPNGSVRIEATRIHRLVIEHDPPLALSRATRFTLHARAFDARGDEIDLSLVRDEALAWSAPASVEIHRPRCGHMVPLCIGSVGNGHLMHAEVGGESPVTVSLTVAGQSASVVLTPGARER